MWFGFIPQIWGSSLAAQTIKNPPAVQEDWFLGWEHTLKEGMATHSSILAWRIPRTEEPGRGLQRVGHDSAITLQSIVKQLSMPQVWGARASWLCGNLLCFLTAQVSTTYLRWKSEVLVTQLSPTVCYSMDCTPPGSSVHRISQARILKWVAISFSRGSSPPRDQTWVSRIASRFFTIWPTRD